jgi:large subunit ribosomal protein L35
LIIKDLYLRLLPKGRASMKEEWRMPKFKTHKGAAKRFKKTGTGKIKRCHAYTSHFFGKKSSAQKRNLRKNTLVDHTQEKTISKLIPYK